MNEHELMKQEYIFAKEMIFRIRDIVWILFGFFVTVNLAFYGFIIQFILKSPDFVDKLFSQHISFGLLFAGLIITIVNVTILKIWLREHTQQKENLEAINWIRGNIVRSDKKTWQFYNQWRHGMKDEYENPEKNKTFEAIRFLLVFFVILSFMITFIGILTSTLTVCQICLSLLKQTIQISLIFNLLMLGGGAIFGFLLVFFVVLSPVMTFIELFFALALNFTKILLILLGGFTILYSIFTILDSLSRKRKHQEYIENVRKYNW